jgi:hypothetical protein
VAGGSQAAALDSRQERIMLAIPHRSRLAVVLAASALAPGGGSFAVGDQSAAGQVLFWGDTWAKDNSLPGGPAPTPFKGFVPNPATPACRTNWTTGAGASATPPAS